MADYGKLRKSSSEVPLNSTGFMVEIIYVFVCLGSHERVLQSQLFAVSATPLLSRHRTSYA